MLPIGASFFLEYQLSLGLYAIEWSIGRKALKSLELLSLQAQEACKCCNVNRCCSSEMSSMLATWNWVRGLRLAFSRWHNSSLTARPLSLALMMLIASKLRCRTNHEMMSLTDKDLRTESILTMPCWWEWKMTMMDSCTRLCLNSEFTYLLTYLSTCVKLTLYTFQSYSAIYSTNLYSSYNKNE